MNSKFFFKPFVAIPVAPIITGIIIYFIFYIRWIPLPKLLHFSFFSSSFCVTFLSAGIATFISMHIFCFLFLMNTTGLFAAMSVFVCTHWIIIIIIIIITVTNVLY
jgi:hypothetical protein